MKRQYGTQNLFESTFTGWWIVIALFFSIWLGFKTYTSQLENLNARRKSHHQDQVAYATSDGFIWLATADGFSSTEKIGSAEGITNLRWSLDGMKLLLEQNINESYTLSVINIETDEIIHVFGPTKDLISGNFCFHSSRLICFTVSEKENQNTVYLYDLHLRQIPNVLFSSSSDEYPRLVALSPDEQYTFLHIGTGSAIRQYLFSLKTLEAEALPDRCPTNLYDAVFVDMPDEANRLAFFTPHDPGLWVYETESKDWFHLYKDWEILYWLDQKFFIAEEHDSDAHIPGIFSVNKTNGKSQPIAPDIVESTPLHTYRQTLDPQEAVLSPDGKLLAFWEASFEDKGNQRIWYQTLYIAKVSSGNTKAIWRVLSKGPLNNAGYRNISIEPYAMSWIPNTDKVLVFLLNHWALDNLGGAMFVVDTSSQEVIPLAGSAGEYENINGIANIGVGNVSPTGEWIMFTYGRRDYIIRTDGSHLTKLGPDRISVSIYCDKWSPSGDYISCHCLSDLSSQESHICIVNLSGRVVFEESHPTNWYEWRPNPSASK